MKAIIIILCFLIIVRAATDILCTQKYCETYKDDNVCPDLPLGCTIQNDTHNGIVLPFTGSCNCCEYCVENIGENDSCAIGDAASPVPRVICGDLLACEANETGNICVPIITNCTEDQAAYDDRRESGELGHLELRPNCDRRGLYETYKCIPGEICYCVDEDGRRIFGEMPFTILASTIMNCACSRQYEKATEFLGKKLLNTQFLRCGSSGDYDPLQCIEDSCFCVHTDDGSEAINLEIPVNVTNISNETLSCFDEDIHIRGEYYRECEAQVLEILNVMEEFKSEGIEVIGYSMPNCQLDGYYGPVQSNLTHKYCADPDGNVLEDFIIGIKDELAEEMDCKCARSRYITSSDKPQCCPNGNYNAMQCRRGLCRCVDANGNQIGKEVAFLERKELECFQTGCVREDEEGEEEEEEEEEEAFAFFFV